MPVPLGSTIVPSPSSSTTVAAPQPPTSAPYPASTKSLTADISSVPTTVTRISFSDRLLITITQRGKLAQWYHVALDTSNPTTGDPMFSSSNSYISPGGNQDPDNNDDGLLPHSQFTPKPLLGASGATDREVLGNLYASQIASLVKQRDEGETRTLVLGLGLAEADVRDREAFEGVVGLVLGVL